MIFLVLPGERVVVLDQEKDDHGRAIVLRADGTINFYEDGHSMSTGLGELSVIEINPQVRRRMAETVKNVTAPKGFKEFAKRLWSILCTGETQPAQERPHSEHWPFANTLR